MDEKRRAYMREYMARKRAKEVSPKDLPVPVLADDTSQFVTEESRGEARESTKRTDDGSVGSYPKAIGIDEPERCSSGDSQRRAKLSKSDQLKDQDRPGWYIFGDTERQANCWLCGKKYTTKLEMGRFCSPKCKNEFLDSSFGKRKQHA